MKYGAKDTLDASFWDKLNKHLKHEWMDTERRDVKDECIKITREDH